MRGVAVDRSGWSRRGILSLSAAAVGLQLMPAAIARATAAPNDPPEGFREASQMVTGIGGLDPVLARRYWKAFTDAAPERLKS